MVMVAMRIHAWIVVPGSVMVMMVMVMVMVTMRMRMRIHAWIVGKVEAPAKAKRIELNAGKWSLRD